MRSEAYISSLDRRQFLKRTAATAAGTTLASSAGCLQLLGLSGSPTGLNGGPTFQDVQREDADIVAESASTLEAEINRGGGRIIWIPSDTAIDLSGRNLTLRHVTIASGRSDDGSGALLATSDRGRGSPTMSNALFTLEEGGRLTGVTIRGPHWNYTASPVIPGYIPFAPGETRPERARWRSDWYARGVSMQADSSQFDNCELWGFSTGIMVGSRESPASPSILYSALHNCMMTSAGYPIDVNRGTPTIYRCAFDAYRHAICGYGTADAGYLAIECDFGPHASSHPIDMHRIGENESGANDESALRWQWRAGGTMLVRNSIIRPTRVVDQRHHNGANAGPYEPDPYINHNRGGFTPHVLIRGAPADGIYLEGNQCAHPDPETGIDQSSFPGRQRMNEFGWHNIFTQQNQWDVPFSQ